jgi:hypothetical protein
MDVSVCALETGICAYVIVKDLMVWDRPKKGPGWRQTSIAGGQHQVRAD